MLIFSKKEGDQKLIPLHTSRSINNMLIIQKYFIFEKFLLSYVKNQLKNAIFLKEYVKK